MALEQQDTTAAPAEPSTSCCVPRFLFFLLILRRVINILSHFRGLKSARSLALTLSHPPLSLSGACCELRVFSFENALVHSCLRLRPTFAFAFGSSLLRKVVSGRKSLLQHMVSHRRQLHTILNSGEEDHEVCFSVGLEDFDDAVR